MRLHVLSLAIALLCACKSRPAAKPAAVPANTASSASAPAGEPGSDVGDCCCVDSKDPQAGTLYTGVSAAARCQRENGTCVAEFGDIDSCIEAANLGTGVPAGD